MKEAQAPSAVTISDVSYIHTTIVDELPEAEKTWYTQLEMKKMKLQTYHDSLRLSSLMHEPFTSEQKLQCLGIESLIVPAFAIKARQERENHVRLILRAQQFCTAEELSVLSSKMSASAFQHAYLLANRDFE